VGIEFVVLVWFAVPQGKWYSSLAGISAMISITIVDETPAQESPFCLRRIQKHRRRYLGF
jgi:hypothetical protein